MRKPLTTALLAAMLAATAPAKAAGIPVIDVAAITQLIQQLSYWQQQIAAMSHQLTQLQQTHAAMIGDRGMQSVLPTSNLQRNYLPPDYAELMKTVDGNSKTYAGLSAQIQSAITANAVLTKEQLDALSPEMRQSIEASRRSTAMIGALSQAAYQHTSQRFAALQQLITMIGSAADTKAIQDLQTRVTAEQTMLANEQTKLQTLYQVVQAEHLVQEQRLREQVTAAHGGFSSRFAPTPD